MTLRSLLAPLSAAMAFLAGSWFFVGCGPLGVETPTLSTILTGLNNPTGLTVLGDGGLIISESGAARLLRWTPPTDEADAGAAASEAESISEAFSLGTFIPYDIGPLSVLALTDGTIAVGEGGQTTGQERVTFYNADGAQRPTDTLTPIAGGNFHAITQSPAGELFIASARSNRIYRAIPGSETLFAEPTDFIADTTAPPVLKAAPTALAFDPDGNLLVGFADDAGGAILRITTTAVEGESIVLDEVYTTSRMVTAIAIRPTENTIHFAEAAFNGIAGSGRVAKITADGGIETVASNPSAPVAIAFADATTLYIALLGGTPNADAGSILRITLTAPDEPASDDADPPEPAAPTAEAPDAGA
jgi:hypothetical protein